MYVRNFKLNGKMIFKIIFVILTILIFIMLKQCVTMVIDYMLLIIKKKVVS